MDYVMSDASKDDTELLASLIRESFADVAKRFGLTPENCPTHPSNCAPEWIQAAFAKGVKYYLLQTSHRPAGCVALERVSDDVCYLERLAVLPSFRRNGFGEALVNHVVETARELGLRTIEIGTIAAQMELRHWYERQGFEVTRVASFERLPFDVAFMRKTLTDKTAPVSKESDREIEGDIRACGG